MDPNNWPVFVWLVIALGLGSIVASFLLLLWRAIFSRGPGWMLDSLLLGSSGFVLVFVTMVYMLLFVQRVPKEWQRSVGCLVLVAVGLPLAWASGRIRKWRIESRSNRNLGSAKREFTVPENFNKPLPREVEDRFYKEGPHA